MSFSLIVPIAANKKEYKKQIPEEFLFTQEGLMRCVRAIMGIDLTIFISLFFVNIVNVIFLKNCWRHSLSD